MYYYFKIVLDEIFSFFSLIFLIPILIIVSLACLLAQGRPVFFRDLRLGKKGKPFQMIKFRTMKNGPSLSSEDDEKRLTAFGKFLRKTSIDELPVFFNVLKLDMSIVGPRPLPVKYLNRFDKYQIKRLDVKPGITGLAQINGRNKLSWEDKFFFDVKYVKQKSFLLDLKIIFKTFFTVILAKGVESTDSEIMPEFMGSLKDKNDKPQ